MLKIKKYEGLVAAPFTPMDKYGNLNTEMVPDYYRFLEKPLISPACGGASLGCRTA